MTHAAVKLIYSQDFVRLPSKLLGVWAAFLIDVILQVSPLKTMVDPAAVIRLIDTSVTPIVGAYNTSRSKTREVMAPLGTLMYMSPFPIALNERLSAAVIGFGGIAWKLMNLSRYPDMWCEAPES